MGDGTFRPSVVDSDLKVDGLAELERRLSELPTKLAKNIMRGALRAGGGVFRAEAKTRVPVASGALRDSIRVSARLKGTEVTARVTAGGRTRKGDAFYAHMVEFGTQAHAIRSKYAKPLMINGRFVRGELQHPGASARPFMRPTFDGGAQRAVGAIAKYIADRLAKEAK